jgi:hypothetical protein
MKQLAERLDLSDPTAWVGSEDSNGKIDGLLNAAGRGRDDWKLVGARRRGRRVGVGRVRIAPAAGEPQH